MKLAVELLLVVVLIARETVNLTCGCSKDCGLSFCVLPRDLEGDYCYAVRKRNTSHPNETVLKRGCYNSTLSTSLLCGTRTHDIAIECCNTHYCNNLLYPELLPINGTSPPPVITLEPSRPTKAPTALPPQTLNIICHDSNSKKPLKERPFCHTYTGSCYRLQRFNPIDGSVISERQGCSENCVNERRNRLHRHCCNTSLCNKIDNPLRPTQEIVVPQVSSSHISSSSSVHTQSSSSSTISSLIVQSTPLHEGTPAGSSSSSSTHNGDTNLITLFVLSAAYLMVTMFIFILLAVVCYKQRQVNTLRNSIKAANKRGVNKRETSQKSLDTITTSSGGDSV